ncbi:hypothetical protein [Martelella sp. AMO21009]
MVKDLCVHLGGGDGGADRPFVSTLPQEDDHEDAALVETAAPPRQRQSVEQYKIVKRA